MQEKLEKKTSKSDPIKWITAVAALMAAAAAFAEALPGVIGLF